MAAPNRAAEYAVRVLETPQHTIAELIEYVPERARPYPLRLHRTVRTLSSGTVTYSSKLWHFSSYCASTGTLGRGPLRRSNARTSVREYATVDVPLWELTRDTLCPKCTARVGDSNMLGVQNDHEVFDPRRAFGEWFKWAALMRIAEVNHTLQELARTTVGSGDLTRLVSVRTTLESARQVAALFPVVSEWYARTHRELTSAIEAASNQNRPVEDATWSTLLSSSQTVNLPISLAAANAVYASGWLASTWTDFADVMIEMGITRERMPVHWAAGVVKVSRFSPWVVPIIDEVIAAAAAFVAALRDSKGSDDLDTVLRHAEQYAVEAGMAVLAESVPSLTTPDSAGGDSFVSLRSTIDVSAAHQMLDELLAAVDEAGPSDSGIDLTRIGQAVAERAVREELVRLVQGWRERTEYLALDARYRRLCLVVVDPGPAAVVAEGLQWAFANAHVIRSVVRGTAPAEAVIAPRLVAEVLAGTSRDRVLKECDVVVSDVHDQVKGLLDNRSEQDSGTAVEAVRGEVVDALNEMAEMYEAGSGVSERDVFSMLLSVKNCPA